jgi:hypothetical protein
VESLDGWDMKQKQDNRKFQDKFMDLKRLLKSRWDSIMQQQ